MRLLPVIVTIVPTMPHVRENEVIVGAQLPAPVVEVNWALLETVSAVDAFVSVMNPDAAGAAAQISVSETIVKSVAAVAPNSTPVTSGFTKSVPVIMTTQLAGPLSGVNPLMPRVANAGT
jgi:hypothetical protein